jgi:hypothetical protein
MLSFSRYFAVFYETVRSSLVVVMIVVAGGLVGVVAILVVANGVVIRVAV